MSKNEAARDYAVRGARLSVFLLLMGCDTPRDSIITRCSYDVSRTVTCGLSLGVLAQRESTMLDPRSKNLKARVRGSFTLEQGDVAVVFLGCAERARVNVVPGPPVYFECDTEVNRINNNFPVEAFAMGGQARGLKGEFTITPL